MKLINLSSIFWHKWKSNLCMFLPKCLSVCTCKGGSARTVCFTTGLRVGLRGRGFFGGLSLAAVGLHLASSWDLLIGGGGRGTLTSRRWGEGAGRRGRTMLTGCVPLEVGPGLRGSTSLLVWGSCRDKYNTIRQYYASIHWHFTNYYHNLHYWIILHFHIAAL